MNTEFPNTLTRESNIRLVGEAPTYTLQDLRDSALAEATVLIKVKLRPEDIGTTSHKMYRTLHTMYLLNKGWAENLGLDLLPSIFPAFVLCESGSVTTRVDILDALLKDHYLLLPITHGDLTYMRNTLTLQSCGNMTVYLTRSKLLKAYSGGKWLKTPNLYSHGSLGYKSVPHRVGTADREFEEAISSHIEEHINIIAGEVA